MRFGTFSNSDEGYEHYTKQTFNYLDGWRIIIEKAMSARTVSDWNNLNLALSSPSVFLPLLLLLAINAFSPFILASFVNILYTFFIIIIILFRLFVDIILHIYGQCINNSLNYHS